jgi:hypothetical protein
MSCSPTNLPPQLPALPLSAYLKKDDERSTTQTISTTIGQYYGYNVASKYC